MLYLLAVISAAYKRRLEESESTRESAQRKPREDLVGNQPGPIQDRRPPSHRP